MSEREPTWGDVGWSAIGCLGRVVVVMVAFFGVYMFVVTQAEQIVYRRIIRGENPRIPFTSKTSMVTDAEIAEFVERTKPKP